MFELARQNQEKPYLPFDYSTNDLAHIQNILQSQAPLISIKEINNLRQVIAKAARGEYFLIQSGDCAESFYECDQDTTYEKLEFIQQLGEFFQRKTGNSMLQIGRIAGQYVKPRSYLPEPWQMLLSYNCSASIYREINQWNRALKTDQKIYTSHEALVLAYEQALTLQDKRTGLYYNRSTHFPWLGKRNISSMEHIDYLRKIANPIAIKVDPDTAVPTLIKTINRLDPDYVPGRITLIPRLGTQKVHHILPQLIEAVKKTQRTVLWSCDPMHGNTETLSPGRTIRKLSAIVEEIKSSFLIHRTMGSQLNAIHLEATHQDVTECVDYKSSLSNSVTDFKKSDKNLVNPRLNYAQTMHVIQCVTKYYSER